MNIPIGNLYYLLLYAWNMLEEAEALDIQAIPDAQLADLFARVLVAGTDRQIQRGLDRDYTSITEEIRRIRGKLELGPSIKRSTLPTQRAVCTFDEFSYDILHNQIIRSTLENLLRVENLSDRPRTDVRRTYRRLSEVSTIPLQSRDFGRVQLHRNNRSYRFLITVCELIYRALLPDPDSGTSRFQDFREDESYMRRVFEEFVRRFYAIEQSEFEVGRSILRWRPLEVLRGEESLLPQMVTDVTLVSPDRVILIETKFVRDPLQHHRESDSLRSKHLYQLFAYLENFAANKGVEQPVEGILLYPTVDVELEEEYILRSKRVRVLSVDLRPHWQEIYQQLLSFLH